ncbi:hypothetical protein JCM11251_000440 [Rhodosporidiobolus azoricus]
MAPAPWLSLPLLLLCLPASITASPSPSSIPPSSGPGSSVARRAGNPVPGVLFAGDYVCRMEGECAPCPSTEINTPVCRLYGNRRSLSCIPRRNGKEVSSSYTHHTSPSSNKDSSKPSKDRPFFPAEPVNPLDQDEDRLLEEADEDLLRLELEGGGRGDSRGAGRAAAAEPGRLHDGSAAEEELQLAAQEVEAELSGATSGEGAAGRGMGGVGRTGQKEAAAQAELSEALANDRQRRGRRRNEPRFVLDEAEYARLLRTRTGEEVSSDVGGMGRRQNGVQLKVQAWEACPKVLKQEKEDFFEYVLCNVFFALLSLSVLVYRQRTLALRQFGRLAARIMQTEVVNG